MKALVWNAAEQMDWEDREKPQPQAGEVLLKVEAVGVCGSEIEGYLGHNSLRVPPLIMGHEFCARIERFESGAASVDGLEIGRRVVVNPLLFCGECDRCLKGLTQLCDKRAIIGIHRPGAFAEWVVVPESAVVPVSESLSPERASLAEPLACSFRAAKRAMQGHELANVVVFGAGAIGLLCAMSAKLLGASRVMIVDTNDARLEMASGLGIGVTANPSSGDLNQAVQAAFGRRGVDVVIDAAGFQPTREAAIRLVNPGGTFMNIGLGIDDTVLPINHLIRSEIEILGSFCYTRQDFQQSVSLLESGKITEEGWTEIRPLAEGAGAFADLVRGKVKNGKIFLRP